MKTLNEIISSLTDEEKEKFKDLIKETIDRQNEIENMTVKSNELLKSFGIVNDNIVKNLEDGNKILKYSFIFENFIYKKILN